MGRPRGRWWTTRAVPGSGCNDARSEWLVRDAELARTQGFGRCFEVGTIFRRGVAGLALARINVNRDADILIRERPDVVRSISEAERVIFNGAEENLRVRIGRDLAPLLRPCGSPDRIAVIAEGRVDGNRVRHDRLVRARRPGYAKTLRVTARPISLRSRLVGSCAFLDPVAQRFFPLLADAPVGDLK